MHQLTWPMMMMPAVRIIMYKRPLSIMAEAALVVPLLLLLPPFEGEVLPVVAVPAA